MAQVTVQQLAEVVGTPVDKLLEQLKDAGLSFSAPDQEISDSEKLQLLEHLRQSKGSKLGGSAEGKKITLRRKSTSQLKVSGGGQGRSATTKTVNVEVRRKKTYVQRSELIEEQEQKRKEEEEIEQQKLAAEQKVQDLKDAEAARIADEERKAQEEIVAKEAEQQRIAAEAVTAAQEKQASSVAPSAPAAPVNKEPVKDKKVSRNKGKDDDHAKRKELHVASDKRGRRKPKTRSRTQRVEASGKHAFERPVSPVVREVLIPESISVADLAQKMAIKAAEVIKVMMNMGAMATINQVIDQDTAILVVEELGHTAKPFVENDIESKVIKHVYDSESSVTRPPVVTVMGHVDQFTSCSR
jgi:translation initiation factor IF-2